MSDSAEDAAGSCLGYILGIALVLYIVYVIVCFTALFQNGLKTVNQHPPLFFVRKNQKWMFFLLIFLKAVTKIETLLPTGN